MKKIEPKNTAGEVMNSESMQVKNAEIANRGHRRSRHLGTGSFEDVSRSKVNDSGKLEGNSMLEMPFFSTLP